MNFTLKTQENVYVVNNIVNKVQKCYANVCFTDYSESGENTANQSAGGVNKN